MKAIGRHLYGIAAVWLGVVGLCFADFAAVWQPVPKDLPGRTALAYGCAALLVFGGAAIQWRRTAREAALGLAGLYTPFMLLWAWRVVGHPAIFGTWSGTAEQLAIVTGGAMAWAALEPAQAGRAIWTAKVGQVAFGLCLLAFGTAHFLYPTETAALVPKWMPGGQTLWAYVTGACHLAAGLALLSGFAALWAGRLVTAMFVGFGALVWAPQLMAHPHDHMAWAGNGINLALVGSAWVVADLIAQRLGRA